MLFWCTVLFDIRVSSHKLISKKKLKQLKISGSYTLNGEAFNFAEIQFFEPKQYRQYSYSISATELFNETQTFDFIETTAAKDK